MSAHGRGGGRGVPREGIGRSTTQVWAARRQQGGPAGERRPAAGKGEERPAGRVKPVTARARMQSTAPRGGHRRRKYSFGAPDDTVPDTDVDSTSDAGLPPRPATSAAWMAFTQELRQINDSAAATVFASHGVKLEKGASPQFVTLVEDFRFRRQQQLEAMAAQAESERLRNLGFDDADSDDSGAEEEQEAGPNPLRVTALRAWARLRRNVQEMAMERRNTGAALSWSFLNQTIKRMTNMERGRQELYDKYLKRPDEWKEGFINTHMLAVIDKYKRPQREVSPRPSRSPSPTGMPSRPRTSARPGMSARHGVSARPGLSAKPGTSARTGLSARRGVPRNTRTR